MPVANPSFDPSAAINMALNPTGSPNRGPATNPGNTMNPGMSPAGATGPNGGMGGMPLETPASRTGIMAIIPSDFLTWGACVQLLFLITVFALVCSCAPTSDWMNCNVVVNDKNNTETIVEIGLWKMCLSKDKKLCEKIPGKVYGMNKEGLLVSARVFNFLSIVFCFFSIMSMNLIIYFYRSNTRQPGMRKTSVCCCVTNLIILTFFVFASWGFYMGYRKENEAFFEELLGCHELKLAGGYIRQVVASALVGCVLLFMPCWAWKGAESIPQADAADAHDFGPFPQGKTYVPEEMASNQSNFAQPVFAQPQPVPMSSMQMFPATGMVVPPSTPDNFNSNSGGVHYV